MIELLIGAALVFVPKPVSAKEEAVVYEQIKRNNPKLPEWYVLRLTNEIKKVTKKYKLPKNIFTAMLMQESAYDLTAKNCNSGRCTDFGIGQVHISSVKRYGFSIKRLTNDLEYSLEAGARILSDFQKRYSKKESKYWTRYNSSNSIARSVYAKRVNQWF